jgi:hypothetical protein
MATDATLVGTHDTPSHDTLVPDPQVQKEFGVTAMSIWRWDRDPELIKLGWPPPIRFLPLRSLTRTVQQYSAMSCGGEYIDNLLDGFVGAVVCGFELAIWTVVRIRAVVEAAVGDRSAEPFMEEQK